MSIKSKKYKFESNKTFKPLTLLLTTSCLALGGSVVSSSNTEAAAVSPTVIGAKFSDAPAAGTWSPSPPQDGDIITTLPLNRTIWADVTGRKISLFITNGLPGGQTAPVYIQKSYQITRGAPVPANDPIRQSFGNDNTMLEIFMSVADPVITRTNIWFDGTVFPAGGPAVVSPNSTVKLYGDNLNPSFLGINLFGGTIAGGAGILDLVGTSAGTNITGVGLISNLRDLYVRDKNFASFGFNLSLGRDVVLYNNSTLQLASGVSLVAAKMKGDTIASNTRLIMVNNNIVDAEIGQGSDIPLTSAQVGGTSPGYSQFSKSVRFTGDITLTSIGVRLRPMINLTAVNILPTINTGDLYVGGANSIIDAKVNNGTFLLRDIILEAGGGIVEFKQDVSYSRNFGLGATVSAKFDGNVSGPQITTAFTDTALEFANSSPSTVTPNIGTITGTGSNINLLRFSGASVTFTGRFGANSIIFSNPTLPSTLTIAPTQDLGAIPITTAASGRIHNIATSATQNISASIGSNTNPLGSIILSNSNTLNINTTTFYSDVTTTTSNTGVVNFVSPGSFSYDLGTAALPLNNITFKGNGTVNGRAYAQSITVNTGVGAGFVTRGFDNVTPVVTTTNGITLQGLGSIASFGANAKVNSAITAATNNIGTAIFGANNVITGAIGTTTNKLALVNFNGTGSTLNGSAYATEIDVAAGSAVVFNSAAVTTTNGVVFQGAGASASFADNIVLNSAVLTKVNNTGTVAFGNNPTINGSLGSSTLQLALVAFNGNTNFSGQAYSQEIDIASGKTVNFTGNTITTTNGLIFQGAGGIANFSQNVAVTGPILSTTAHTGTVNFNAGTTAGVIGSSANPLALVKYGANSAQNGDVYSDEVDIAANSKVTFASTNFSTLNGLKFLGAGAEANFSNNVIFNGPAVPTSDLVGTLKFLGTATVNGALGATARQLNLVSYAKNSTQNGSVYAREIDISAGASVNFNGSNVAVPLGVVLQGAGATANFADNLYLSNAVLTTINNTGTVIFNETPTIYAELGSSTAALALVSFLGKASPFLPLYAQRINIAAGKNVFFSMPNIAVPSGIHLQGPSATYIANFSQNITASFIADQNNAGNINMFGTLTGNIGSSASAVDTTNLITKVTVNGDIYSRFIRVSKSSSAILNSNFIVTSLAAGISLQGIGSSLTFGPNVQITGPIFAEVNHQGSVTFQGPNPNPISSSIGTPASSLALVTYNGNVTQNGDVYSDEVDIAANTKVAFGSANFSTLNGLKFLGTAAEANFTNNVTFNGPAVAASNVMGTLKFLGTATVNGSLGSASNNLFLLSYAKNSTQSGNVYASEVDIAGSATVNFNAGTLQTTKGIILQGAGATANLANNLTANTSVLTTANNTGTLVLGSNVTATGNFGASGAALALINLNGTLSTLNGSIYSQEIDVAPSASATLNAPSVNSTSGVIFQGAGGVVNFGSNVVLNSAVTTLNAGTGTVTFADNPDVNGAIGTSAKRLMLVAFNGNANIDASLYANEIDIAAGKSVTLNLPALETVSGIVFQGAGAAANFTTSGVVIKSPILTTAANTGSALFGGGAVITGDLGSSALPLLDILFNSGTSVVNGSVFAQGAVVGAGASVTLNSGVVSTTSGLVLQDANSTVSFAANASVTGPTLAATNSSGVINYADNVTQSGDVGMASKQIRVVNYNGNNALSGSLYAQDLNIAAGKSVNFTGPLVQMQVLRYQGAGASAVFSPNTNVTGLISTIAPEEGNTVFQGSTILNAQVGGPLARTGSTTFTADNTQNLVINKDIYSNTVNIANTNLNLSANRTISASSTFDGTAITFNQNTLTLGGGNSAFKGSPVFNVYFDNVNNSHLALSQDLDSVPVLTAGGAAAPITPAAVSTLDLTGVTLLTFNINDQSSPPPPQGRIYYFYLPQDLANILYTINSKVDVNSNNPFATWFYSQGVLYQIGNVAGGIGVIIGDLPNNQTVDNALLLAYPDLAGDALDFLNAIRYLVLNGDLDGARSALLRVLLAINPTDMAMIDTIGDLLELVENRTDNVIFSNFLVDSGLGAGAGDDKIREDVALWFEPFYGKANQKKEGVQSGYKSKASGATIGLDTNINDNTLIGAALSYIRSNLNYRDIKSGDKSSIDTLLATLYGAKEFKERIFVQGLLTIGSNTVRNAKPRINNEVAIGKYRATSYGAEAFAGYRCPIAKSTILTPILGAKYSRFQGQDYTEKQTTYLNLKIKKKAYNKIELRAGGKIDSQIEHCGTTFTPQLSAFVNYDLSNKATKALVTLDGFPAPYVPFVGKKPTRVIYNAGAALAITKGATEYELSYDGKFAKKYYAHQGALKVRVRF